MCWIKTAEYNNYKFEGVSHYISCATCFRSEVRNDRRKSDALFDISSIHRNITTNPRTADAKRRTDPPVTKWHQSSNRKTPRVFSDWPLTSDLAWHEIMNSINNRGSNEQSWHRSSRGGSVEINCFLIPAFSSISMSSGVIICFISDLYHHRQYGGHETGSSYRILRPH